MRFHIYFSSLLWCILSFNKNRCFCIINEQSSLSTTLHNTVVPKSLIPLWKRNIWMDLYVFVTDKSSFDDYKATPDWACHLQNTEEQEFIKHINIQPKHNSRNVKPLFAHIFLVKDSFPIDPANKSYSLDSIVYVYHGLTKHYGDGLLYWHDTVTISVVHDTNQHIKKNTVHPVTLTYFLNNRGGGYGTNQHVAFYRPVVFPNDCWLIRKDARIINETTSVLPLTIQLETINLWKFNVYAVLASKTSLDNHIVHHSIDETKRTIADSYPSLMLSCTLLTFVLHGLFEILAFKHDLLFWMNKKNRIGVSVNSIIISIILRVILFIHFSDSNHVFRTFEQIASIGMEFWKLHTLLGYEYHGTLIQNKMRLTIRLVRVQHRSSTLLQQKGEKLTHELDTTALLYTLCIALPAYIFCTNVFYQSTSIDFLNDFGCFIVAVPQLYINHHMKIVHHVSFATLFYKIVNICIDNVFAFAIGMSVTQRLQCTKHDILIIIYYLQKSKIINTPLFTQKK